jgi:hypothetical protein
LGPSRHPLRALFTLLGVVVLEVVFLLAACLLASVFFPH